MYQGKNKKYLKQVRNSKQGAEVIQASTAAVLYGLVSGAVGVVASGVSQAASKVAATASSAVNATAPYVKEAAQAVVNATLSGSVSIEPTPIPDREVCYNSTVEPREKVTCPTVPCGVGCDVVMGAVVAGVAVAAVVVMEKQCGLFSRAYRACKGEAAPEAVQLTDAENPRPRYGSGSVN